MRVTARESTNKHKHACACTYKVRCFSYMCQQIGILCDLVALSNNFQKVCISKFFPCCALPCNQYNCCPSTPPPALSLPRLGPQP